MLIVDYWLTWVCSKWQYARYWSGDTKSVWPVKTYYSNSEKFSLLDSLKACPHCCRKVRQWPIFAVVSPFSVTVTLFCDSVDRA